MVHAAGGVIIRGAGAGAETLLIHRPRHRDWSFPKGKLDAGETAQEAALREVHEETAWRCALGPSLGSVVYPIPGGGRKPTRYWVMTPLSDDGFQSGAEVDALRWVSLQDAADAVTHRLDRELAGRVASRMVNPIYRTSPRAPRL